MYMQIATWKEKNYLSRYKPRHRKKSTIISRQNTESPQHQIIIVTLFKENRLAMVKAEIKRPDG